MDSSVKQITISGGAMADFKKRRGTTRKTRAPQTGGFDTAPGPAIAIGAMNISKIGSLRKNIGGAFQSGGASSGPAAAAAAPSSGPSPTLPSAGSAGTSAATQPPMPAQPPAATAPQLGGATKKGLVLAPPKKQTRKSKVHLAPPASKDKKPVQHLKTTRKIRVHLGGMKIHHFHTQVLIHILGFAIMDFITQLSQLSKLLFVLLEYSIRQKNPHQYLLLCRNS